METVVVRNYARGEELLIFQPASSVPTLRGLVPQNADITPLSCCQPVLQPEGNDRCAVFKSSEPPTPNSLNQTRDTNTISVSHDHLMVSKRPMIITHIIKLNN